MSDLNRYHSSVKLGFAEMSNFIYLTGIIKTSTKLQQSRNFLQVFQKCENFCQKMVHFDRFKYPKNIKHSYVWSGKWNNLIKSIN